MGGGSSRVLVIANQKGGVGKTTTAINLSFSLTLFGRRVLLVDIDSQGNATSGLGVKGDSSHLFRVLTGEFRAEDAVVETDFKGLFLIPGGPSLLECETKLLSFPKRERMLRDAIKDLKNSFDFVIIDCPPSLGVMTLNALVAGDEVIVPVQCEYFALEGLGSLLKTIRKVRSLYNPCLFVKGILLTMYDSRNRLSREVEREVKRLLKNKVFKTVIPRNVRLGEAPSYGIPVYLHDRNSKGAKSYIELAREILDEKGAGKELGGAST